MPKISYSIGKKMGNMRCQKYPDKNPIKNLELSVRARQLDSVAQLVRALHRNRRAASLVQSYTVCIKKR